MAIRYARSGLCFRTSFRAWQMGKVLDVDHEAPPRQCMLSFVGDTADQRRLLEATIRQSKPIGWTLHQCRVFQGQLDFVRGYPQDWRVQGHHREDYPLRTRILEYAPNSPRQSFDYSRAGQRYLLDLWKTLPYLSIMHYSSIFRNRLRRHTPKRRALCKLLIR